MKIGDVIIIVVLVAVSFLIAYMTLTKDISNVEIAYLISYKNETILELAVDEDDSGVYTFEFDKYRGAVEVKDNKIRILPMPVKICPKQLCSRFGWAGRVGDILVCLPNKIVVQVIEGKGDENDGADTVSF
tara:strand:- start:804 stop:1196 length:393 start_codon:yes stop_codon:yes gene_type:complete